MFLAKFAATEIKCRQNDNRRVFGGQTDDLDIINNEQRVDRCTFTSQLAEIHYSKIQHTHICYAGHFSK